jgi:putative nucleotidyltransferase with HDIG domain
LPVLKAVSKKGIDMGKPIVQMLTTESHAAGDLRHALGHGYDMRAQKRIANDEIARDERLAGAIVICDMDAVDDVGLAALKEWRRTPEALLKPIIFIGQDSDRKRLLAHDLLTGANFVRRPFDGDVITGLVQRLSATQFKSEPEPQKRQKLYLAHPSQAAALEECDGILDAVFGAFETRERVNVSDISARSATIVESLHETGLDTWIKAVRNHHNLTYQHCLLVTGTLVGFGQFLGMRRADLQRLATGGLLHDIGKAGIPLSILDKPTTLTPEEMSLMQRHPTLGVARLQHASGVSESLVRLVRDHHEFLDGSGYPGGLMAESIPDPVRLLTIADIFSALIEKRSYKPPMPSVDAIEIMGRMQGRLDPDLFKAVQQVMLKVSS